MPRKLDFDNRSQVGLHEHDHNHDAKRVIDAMSGIRRPLSVTSEKGEGVAVLDVPEHQAWNIQSIEIVTDGDVDSIEIDGYSLDEADIADIPATFGATLTALRNVTVTTKVSASEVAISVKGFFVTGDLL